jgi:hypothetical protein
VTSSVHGRPHHTGVGAQTDRILVF